MGTTFPPTVGALDEFRRRRAPRLAGLHRGSRRGDLRVRVARYLAAFIGGPVAAASELIITPGTQGALFLAIGAAVTAGDRVAIVRPD